MLDIPRGPRSWNRLFGPHQYWQIKCWSRATVSSFVQFVLVLQRTRQRGARFPKQSVSLSTALSEVSMPKRTALARHYSESLDFLDAWNRLWLFVVFADATSVKPESRSSLWKIPTCWLGSCPVIHHRPFTLAQTRVVFTSVVRRQRFPCNKTFV